jgi:hypothetical protein
MHLTNEHCFRLALIPSDPVRINAARPRVIGVVCDQTLLIGAISKNIAVERHKPADTGTEVCHRAVK